MLAISDRLCVVIAAPSSRQSVVKIDAPASQLVLIKKLFRLQYEGVSFCEPSRGHSSVFHRLIVSHACLQANRYFLLEELTNSKQFRRNVSVSRL